MSERFVLLTILTLWALTMAALIGAVVLVSLHHGCRV
jgi:hypothetical protein